MSWLDKLLGVASTPDWVTPTVDLIKDATNGPAVNIHVDRNAGYSVNDVARTIGNAGVDYWGDMIADGWIVVTVRQGDEAAARSALRRAGIPMG